MMKRFATPSRSITFPLLIAFASWLLLGSLIYFVNPDVLKSIWYAPFWILIWISSTWSISLILGKVARGALYGTAVVIFFALRFFGIGNMLNVLLLLGIAFIGDLYFSGLEK